MDVDGLPIIGPGVDYTQVGAIHQKRTLAFINHFISNTVSFLNKFSRSCELRLDKYDGQIEALQSSLSILEAKLSSISGLENLNVQQESDLAPSTQNEEEKTRQQETETANLENQIKPNEHQMETKEEKITIAQDPQYAKYFRMIQVGVPVQAVRLKMQAEGLDPAVLDNPDLPVSKPAQPILHEEHSDSSFSD